MQTEYYQHPQRFPRNVAGPFYTTGGQFNTTNDPGSPLIWCADCLSCEAPEYEAPDLLAPLNDQNYDTFFVRQPESSEEIERACQALTVCCNAALRYGGKNISIIQRLGNNPELCDYIIDHGGNLLLVIDTAGDLLPFAKEIVSLIRQERERQWQLAKPRKWWQFWCRKHKQSIDN